jgi:carbon-monoxide dehydrogenase large subunit
MLAQGVARRDYEVVTGHLRFTADHEAPGCLHVAIFRSPYAHARIRGVELSRARALPGVVYCLSGDGIPAYARPMPPFPFTSTDPFGLQNPKIKFAPHWGLARGKVRFVGEPVACVVAESPYVAWDALALVEAEFDPLPPLVDEEQALGARGPLLYEEWGDNVLVEFRVRSGDVDRAFQDADLVIREKLKVHRFTGTPIEPRAVFAAYDRETGLLDVWDTTQIPHVIATVLQDSFDIPGLKVRVRSYPVGGGFGQKWGFYPEEWLVALLAIELGRPVKWVETRREHMVATHHAREQTHYVEMALDRDGRILGLRDRIIGNLGAAYPQGGLASLVTTAMYVPGAYKVKNYEGHAIGVVTNKTPFGAHRGFGKSEAAYVIERMMDIAAEALGLDPAEIRFRNFIRPEEFPYVSATGTRYDSGNYPLALRRVLELLDYQGWRAEQARRRRSGDLNRLIGIGFAVTIEPSSSTRMGSYNAGYFSVAMRLDPAGQLVILSSGNDEGQKHWAAAAELAQRELGIDPKNVVYIEGDSLLTPYGSGSYSSRFSVVGASAIIGAARLLRQKVLRLAAHLLRADIEDLVLADGFVVAESTGRRLSLRDVARTAYLRLWELPPDEEPGLEVLYHYRDPNVSFQADENGRVAMFSSVPYTADAAVIEVDAETGFINILKYVSVHDCGNILSPRLVLQQHLGALAHGFGGALYEELPYDEFGQPRHQTFVDYLVPTAREIPEVVVEHIVTPNPFTPGGFKGAGETGAVSPPPVLANALEDALRPLGVKVRHLPLRPDYVWHLVRSGRKA